MVMESQQSTGGWVHIFMEIKARELDSRLLLACFAAERGHNVLIGPHKLFLRMLKRLPAGVIYDRSIFPIRMGELLQHRNRGHSIVVSDEESQGIYADASFRYFDSRLSNETLELCEGYFTWGEEQNKILSKVFPDHAAKFVPTGSPRFDAWRPPFNGLYDDQVAKIRERYGPYILVPSNFGLLMNHLERSQLLDQARRIGTLGSEKGREFWNGVFDFQQQTLEKYREAIIAITTRFTGHKVIVRPHPVDDPEKWNAFLGDVTGCEIVFEGTASPWLKGADLIIHHGCTTSLEAFFMGKNTIAYSPVQNDKYDERLLKKNSLNVSTIDDLVKSVEACLEGKMNTSDHVSEDLPGYFHWEKQRYACEEIVDRITQIISTSHKLSQSGKYKFLVLNTLRNWRARIRKKRIPMGERKWPGGLQLHEIQERVNYYCKSSDRLSNLEVRQVMPEGVFWIKKRDT